MIQKDKEKGNKAKQYRKIIKSDRKIARNEERNKGTVKQPENNMMALVSTYLSIITLDINVINSPIKSHLVPVDKKSRPNYNAAYKVLTLALRTHVCLKWGDGRVIPCKWKQKWAGVTILTSEKTDLIKSSNKTKKITYKVIIYQEDNNHKYIYDQHWNT